MRLRGAICGCGMISEFHLRGWNRIPEVEIVALYNRTISRADQRRQQFAPEAQIYDDLTAMLRAERLDFIDILTPPDLHEEHCLAAQQAGLHIICQKPLCPSREATRRLVDAMRGYPKLFAVHENHRYRPWFRRVRTLVQEQQFGASCFLRIEHLNATEPAEAYKNVAEAGVFLEYGSHLVDMMRSLLGEPLRVYARMHELNSRVQGESLVQAVYEYPGCTAQIGAGWKHAALTQSSVLLVGAGGEVWYEGTLTRGESGRLRITRGDCVVSDEAISPYDEYVESFYLFERECADAMLGRGSIEQTGDEHLKSLNAVFAAYDAARQNRILEVS
jgi:predicted dehydrogenase